CSSNDDKGLEEAEGKVNLSFGPILQDLMTGQQRQANTCAGAVPAFAEIIVSQDGQMVAGTFQDPLRIEFLQDENGAYYTENTPELSLDQGVGVLEYFSILDENENIIWLAPKADVSGVSTFVKNPLPMEITLDVSGPQYVGVEVVCYDKTQADAYGFTLVTSDIQGIEFCIFGNYCDENGRHAEAIQYEVSAWTYSGDPAAPRGINLYENEMSPLDIEDNADGTSTEIARPLCLNLPDGEGEDQYYLEIYYGGDLIRSGVITDAQVKDLYVGEDRMDYFHFREGNCNLADSPDLL
ncbi:MAG TPA: hypothetical protein VFM60_01665, partial [Salinimicrobium sp.]|nr:hypothetical protein [Salinimicrobium sp.]